MQKKARKTRRQLLAEKAAMQQQLVNKANALKNPLETLPKFHQYTTKDNDAIELTCVRAKDASPECFSWIMDIMIRNMKDMYLRSSWSWDEAEKRAELTEETAWYLIASRNGHYLGFSHFRFDIDNGDVVLYCYELQLEPSVRRKGLGRFIMSALETMAYRNKMLKVVLTIFKHNPSAIQFFYALGYKLDNSNPPASAHLDYIILSKQNLCG
ncbi:PREDICTED: N-alpha-acetyltransferase 40 [Vollenhovia emeryi]|uniref:N-alpha-acetyltransferase 40 n=1 Tax=Vollenhovia emeryi TaxID=411798 RepID=UPI0005F3B11E|nr:PREDICTED: N-alpha-acetyltransferase 40 [Vollenhovia emeryi]XP_011874636.1 PREDICTED: N-alpha-acetyltransferase 40 [Vollenhovia emeryi]XP_011874637.1 PREDICTED: N-alpha-acetyltransferase 40 [Vollenhovia emeryi]